MSEDKPHSGSRWEPTPAGEPHLTQPRHEQSTDLLDQPRVTTSARPDRRRRAIVAAAGAGLLLIGGAGGYAIGHATAGSATSSERGHRDGGFRGVPSDTTGDNGTGTGTTGPST